MGDQLDLEDTITTAESEAAIHDLVENGLMGMNAIDPACFGLRVPEGHCLVVMTTGQKQGLIESGARLRKAVMAISEAFYATTGARDGTHHG